MCLPIGYENWDFKSKADANSNPQSPDPYSNAKANPDPVYPEAEMGNIGANFKA